MLPRLLFYSPVTALSHNVLNIFLNNKHYLFIYSHDQCPANEDHYLPARTSSKIIYPLRYYLTTWILRERNYFSFLCTRFRKNIALLKGFLAFLSFPFDRVLLLLLLLLLWGFGEMILTEKTKLLGEKPVLVPLDKPQIPQPSNEPRTL